MKLMKKFVALIILGLVLALVAFGQAPSVSRVPPVPLTTIRAAANVQELTAADVETFLDGIVPLQLDREDVAGAIKIENVSSGSSKPNQLRIHNWRSLNNET
jgi:hypothetical protein